jgi:hypothetical protein
MYLTGTVCHSFWFSPDIPNYTKAYITATMINKPAIQQYRNRTLQPEF